MTLRLHEFMRLPDPERHPGAEPPHELVGATVEYFLAGGAVTPELWRVQSPKERRALVLARRQADRQLALTFDAQPRAHDIEATASTPSLGGLQDHDARAARLAELRGELQQRGQAFASPAELDQRLTHLGLHGLVRATLEEPSFSIRDAADRVELALRRQGQLQAVE